MKTIQLTTEQAKSALAMAQLSQLMKDLGYECDVDWDNECTIKFCIHREYDRIFAEDTRNSFEFLAFKTKKLRDKFMEKHEHLIKEYFMI